MYKDIVFFFACEQQPIVASFLYFRVDMAHVMMADDGGAVHSHSFTDFYVPYPVQNSIPYLPSALKHRCLEELSEHSVVVATPPPLAKVQQQMATIPRGQDFDKFSLALFGPTLQNIFIRPYNEKVNK